MPYDPRPVSEGGNRGMDDPGGLFNDVPEGFPRHAPLGKFRVVGVDTFDGGDWIIKDCDTFQEAKELADENGGSMQKTHVYNDMGKHLYQAGEF
jgi:hypothetical protein